MPPARSISQIHIHHSSLTLDLHPSIPPSLQNIQGVCAVPLARSISQLHIPHFSLALDLHTSIPPSLHNIQGVCSVPPARSISQLHIPHYKYASDQLTQRSTSHDPPHYIIYGRGARVVWGSSGQAVGILGINSRSTHMHYPPPALASSYPKGGCR